MSSDKKIDHLTKLIEGLTQTMTAQFDDMHKEFAVVHRKFDEVQKEFSTMHQDLDEIKFLVTGQEQRICILEDKMRQLAVKVGMEFSR